MDINFNGRATDVKPLFDRLQTMPIYQPRTIVPERNASVNNVIDVLIEELGNPDTKDAALRRFKELPIKYFLAASPDKAALVAERLYRKKLATPEEIFENLVLQIVQNYDIIQRAERRKGLGEPGRLTLGGCVNPGINLENLKSRDDFSVSDVKESLRSSVRQGEPNLAIVFPQFASKSK